MSKTHHFHAAGSHILEDKSSLSASNALQGGRTRVMKLFRESKKKMNVSKGYSKVHGVRKCLELDSWLRKRKGERTLEGNQFSLLSNKWWWISGPREPQ